ncbi:hypothetical protein ACFQS5_25545 [Salinirubellus sp. GCM10025899]|uniref:DUF7557 family protein n=1 Tax=Salinirubellus sp. GCM10025899 TaxID=3252689 RepID=UPI00361A89ED
MATDSLLNSSGSSQRRAGPPYVWVTGSPTALEALTETLRESDKISSVSTLDEFEGEAPDTVQQLYRIEWILGKLDIIRGIIEANGAVLEGYSEEDHWFHEEFITELVSIYETEGEFLQEGYSE